MKFMVINGPNMDMLGIREKDKYGENTLENINKEILAFGNELGIEISFFQSNIEGEIINTIHEGYGKIDGFVINPAAYSYSSVAILDALYAVNIPTVEVHMTNIFNREDFRSKTITASASIGLIAGFGKETYKLAVKSLYDYIKQGVSN
jgi:3-dehydroquinate dehydratase-2